MASIDFLPAHQYFVAVMNLPEIPVIVADANAWKSKLLELSTDYVSQTTLDAARQAAESEVHVGAQLRIAYSELAQVDLTRDALRKVLDGGMWLEIVELQNLVSHILKEAKIIEEQLIRYIERSFQQGEGKTIIVSLDGIQDLVDLSGRAVASFHEKGSDVDEDQQKLIATSTYRMNTRPLREIARMSQSETHRKSPGETARFIDENLQYLLKILDAKVRARTKLAAGEISFLEKILQKIHEYLVHLSQTNSDARIIKRIQKTFIQFRLSLAKLLYHLKEHICPQAGIFVQDMDPYEKLRQVIHERRTLEQALSQYRLAGFRRFRMKHPDSKGQRVSFLSRAQSALNERIRRIKDRDMEINF